MSTIIAKPRSNKSKRKGGEKHKEERKRIKERKFVTKSMKTKILTKWLKIPKSKKRKNTSIKYQKKKKENEKEKEKEKKGRNKKVKINQEVQPASPRKRDRAGG